MSSSPNKNLHHRKAPTNVPTDPNMSAAAALAVGSGDDEDRNGSGSGKKLLLRHRYGALLGCSGELRWALVAVTSFLFLGLTLGYVLLHHQRRKVVLHVMKNPWAHGGAVLRGRAGFTHHFYSGPPRFVTVVLPSVVNPTGRSERLRAIQDTWGPGARAIYVVHNVTEEFPAAGVHHAVFSPDGFRTPYDPYSFPQALELPESISVKEGIPRLFHTMQTVYDKVNPDFAFFVNDHTFVIPEHLCKFLENLNKNPDVDDLYAGHAMKSGQGAKRDENSIFNSGAAGYVLSRATMRKILDRYNDRDAACYVDPDSASHNSKWLQGNPGIVLLDCLNALSVYAFDTRAAKRWHRFHAFSVTRMASGDVDTWYGDKHAGMAGLLDFDASYEAVPTGQDCCSKTTVSFHYVEAAEARALFSVRQSLLRHPQMSDRELTSVVQADWPKTKKEIGHYSRGLPSVDNDAEGWQKLLKVLRMISNRETQRDC